MTKEKVIEAVSYLCMGVFLLIAFSYHLMLTFVSGITLYLLVTHCYSALAPKMRTDWAHNITLLGLIVVLGLILGGISFGIYSAIKAGHSNVQNIGTDIMKILQEIRTYLPASVVGYIPDDFLVVKEKMLDTMKNSSGHIFEVTGHSVKALVHVLIGLFLGAIVAFSYLHHDKKTQDDRKPLHAQLVKRLTLFIEVFKKVMSAQVKISGINTLLTAIYLLMILPLCGVHLPYAKTLVLLTFIIGLIPVLGNLITNTIIFLISLTVSFKVALASIIFLIVVHKLEYYINAKIVGSKIKTSIWELLIAMLVMETFFGVIGVALAPVIYGYLKEELKNKQLV